jgi:hypothetical protein
MRMVHAVERRGWDGLVREDAACRDRPSRSWSEADAGPDGAAADKLRFLFHSLGAVLFVPVAALAWRGCQLTPTPSTINTRGALLTSTATAISIAVSIANVETSTAPAEDVASVTGRVGACT